MSIPIIGGRIPPPSQEEPVPEGFLRFEWTVPVHRATVVESWVRVIHLRYPPFPGMMLRLDKVFVMVEAVFADPLGSGGDMFVTSALAAKSIPDWQPMLEQAGFSVMEASAIPASLPMQRRGR
jgi:hypothetical protein